jgi:mxaJ protein
VTAARPQAFGRAACALAQAGQGHAGGGRAHSSLFPLPSSLLYLLLAACAPGAQAEPARELRVCSDPNNLPFSNEREEGFENRIAELLARELDARLSYTWHAQRRGFIRSTLRAGECDLVMGVPSGFEMALPTRPYYRSTYVFVTRRDRALDIRSFDDPRLRELRIGVHLIGDDYANTPPAHALGDRGLSRNVRGYMIYGDYRQENPPARILDALVGGEIDVAVVWGPLAGYFAARQAAELEIVPVSPQIDLPFLPMVYDISLGVRREDTVFVRELEEIMDRRRPEVERILEEYGVPRIEGRRQAGRHD